MKNIAIVFSGQGSSFIGMGKDIYDAFSEAKDVFLEVDDALSEHLSHIIFNGEEEELNFTINNQPAIMATGIAFLRVLQKQAGFDFTTHNILFAAGHSVGEYTALCAIDSLPLASTARLLRQRALLMSEAMPNGEGGMISLLGVTEETAEKIANKASCSNCFCEISNDNSVGQIVLSGHKEALDKATIIAKEEGVKLVIPLAVSGPFHSSLMKPAALKLKEILDIQPFSAPSIPLISNNLAMPICSIDEIKENLFLQLTSKVRWRESVLYMNNNGVENIVELGGNGVLTKLKKRIAPQLEGYTVSNLAKLEEFMKIL